MLKMVSSRKKRLQNKKLFSQLSEGDTDFMIGQSNHDVQNGNIGSVTHRSPSSDNTNNPTQVLFRQVDIHILKENSVIKV